MVPQQHRTLQPSRCSQSVLPHWGINHVATRHLQATARSRPGTTRSRVATSTSHTAELRADTQWSTPAAPSQASTFAVDVGNFKWLENWYPVHTLESVDPSRPHSVDLLGKQLVLWRDGKGNWQCMEDACPHRLAPLSEGRIEADGTLQCSYHGWRFDSQGRCTEIPQAIDEKAKAVACGSSRSCATRYPVKEECGLIWVWPTAGPAAEAAAAAEPVPLSKGLVAAFNAGKASSWYRRELPYSWDVLVENLTDPSHLPFSHHNLTPSLKREKGNVPMRFSPLDIPSGTSPADAEARPVYTMAHRAPIAAFEFPSAMSPGGRVCFTPPSSVNYQYDVGPGIHMQNDLIAVPAGPGRSTAYTIGFNNVPKATRLDVLKTLFTNPKLARTLAVRYAFQNQAHHKGHLQMNKLFDQDSVFLNMQDRQLASRGKSSWVQDYYMPAPCDGLVVAGRRWAEKALQLPLPVNTGRAAAEAADTTSATAAASVISLSREAAAAPRLPQQQLLNRWAQHTKHCVVCQKALQGIKHQAAAAQTAGRVLLAAAVGVMAGWVLPALVQLVSSSAAAGGGAASAVAGNGSLNLIAGAVIAAIMGIGTWLANAVAVAAGKQIAEFEYVEFSHAMNH